MEILQVQNLTFTYPDCKKEAVKDFSFSVNEGDFVLFTGASGCGKTTLLRLLKEELAPKGERTGEIRYKTNSEVGFVLQNPDSQIVTDKVYHELAFGLENLGLPNEVIRRRVAEISCFFGIHSWFHEDTASLSGGQKQILNLASVMAMHPSILILDEPTSRLDPIAASDFLAFLHRLNEEFGLTILMSEHRLEEVFPYVNQCIQMEKGEKMLEGTPESIVKGIQEQKDSEAMRKALPASIQIFLGLKEKEDLRIPLTVREGREYVKGYCKKHQIKPISVETVKERTSKGASSVLQVKNIWFRYHRDTPDILTGIKLTLFEHEIYSILGGNGAGKTTLLGCIAGIRPIYKGKIEKKKKCVMLPQDPTTVFVKMSVMEDFKEIPNATEENIKEISELLGISELLTRHPFDLSGGEQQKCALGKILLCEPEILLLDEPTKGMDALFKYELRSIFFELRKRMSILMVTHDVEFAAETSDRCGLFFDGEVIAEGTPEEFFGGNHYYTTAANRMSGDLLGNVVTVDQVVQVLQGKALNDSKAVGNEIL